MKKLCSFFILLSLIISPCAYAVVKVPANTSIYVTPVSTVTSHDNNVTEIEGKIVEDVNIENVTVFKSGSKAILQIGEVEKAGCWGNGGKMSLNNGYVFDTKGNKHRVIVNKNYYGETKTWPKIMGGISIFFLFPLALFGFVHGEQAKIPSNIQIETFLGSEVIY